MSDTCDTNLPVYPPSQCFPPDFCPRPPWWNQDPCGCNQQPEWGYWSHKMKRNQEEVQYLEDTLKSILTKWGYQPNGGIDPRIGAIISPVAPLNPWPGMLWFNPVAGMQGVLYIWSGNAGVMSWVAMTGLPLAGITNGSEAAAGMVGEVISVVGIATPLPNATITELGVISLPPGDWQVNGFVTTSMSGATITTYALGWSLNGVSQTSGPHMVIADLGGGGVQDWSVPMSTVRVNPTAISPLAANMSLAYTGGTGTPQAYVPMFARRMR